MTGLPSPSPTGLDPRELRRRWTIELTSLRRRSRPTQQQESRIRDLQAFLAALDPLRKLEFEWHAMAGFRDRLLAEVLSQQRISDPAYRKRLHGRILIALSGASCPAPGAACSRIDAARLVCEDHGEDWAATLQYLVETKLLRRDTDGVLTLGGPGHHAAAAAAEFELRPTPTAATPTSSMFERLNPEVRRLLGAFKLEFSMSGADVSMPRALPSLPAAAPVATRAPTIKASVSTPQRKKARPQPMPPPPKKLLSPREERLFEICDAERVSTSAIAAFNILRQRNILPDWTIAFEVIEEEPRTIWQCSIVVPEVGVDAHCGIGYSQKEARAQAADLALAALKQHLRTPLPAPKAGHKGGTHGPAPSASSKNLRPWPATLQTRRG